VQNLKLVEVLVIETTERVRAPRLPLEGEQRATVERIVGEALANRPALPKVA
jgi:4-hydroxy-tetrahydrodipicolinate synthase